MKIASSTARVLLGILFTVFGLNGFLHFLSMGPTPSGLAGQYLGVLFQSHYLSFVFGVELIAGLLLLVNRYVPLALTALAALLVNILLFHALMAPGGLPLAMVALVLWVASVWNVRSAFAVLLRQKMETETTPAVRGLPSVRASTLS